MTILEAMMSQKAIVASRVGALPELLEHGKSDLLFSPGNTEELTSILRILLDDEGKRRTLGRGAYAVAQARYSPDATLNRLETVYDSILHRNIEVKSENVAG